MIKLIATDMDGTLLNSKNEIQDGFYEVFNKLEEKGIIFAAASGRQYYNLLKRFEGIEDKMMFIAENGTFVVYKGKELCCPLLSFRKYARRNILSRRTQLPADGQGRICREV